MSHILIIEDNKQVRSMLRKLLEQEGFTVTEASDGEEGIRRYNENQADLIITDIVMPNKEGLETILELKKQYRDVKIIAISGGGAIHANNYLQLATYFGAIRTFEKPVGRRELLAAVKELI